MKIGRNQPCPCGSGKKFKKCCGLPAAPTSLRQSKSHLNITAAVETAKNHYQAGRLQQAEDIFKQVLEVESNNVGALYYLGMIAYQANKNEMALRMFKKAIAIKPEEPFFYVDLGNVFFKKNKLDEAASSYRNALELKPDYALAHYNLGVVLNEQECICEAI